MKRRRTIHLSDCTDCKWDVDKSIMCNKDVHRPTGLIYRIPLGGCFQFRRKGMARLNRNRNEREDHLWVAIERDHPPSPESKLREVCEKIEHGGSITSKALRGRRAVSIPDKDLVVLFPSKKEDLDIPKVKKNLFNAYKALVYNCVDNCEDFGRTTPETFCKRKFCVNKSMMRMLAHILHNEVHFELFKEKPKIRKRRIEICDD